MFHQRIDQFIAQHGLLQSTDRVLVALSGGADSVALLRVLLRLGYRCVAAHCNFDLRGSESDADEQFVRTLCEAHQVPLEVIRFDTQGYAATHKLSIEMAARELRYNWFETLRTQLAMDAVAVGHHRDDSVETLLLNLIRGTGIQGLTGISPRNGVVVRPLLEESREEVVAYLNRLNQPYVTDSTNLQDAYTRNKIRLQLLPLLSEINPSITDTLAQTTQRLSEVERLYTAATDEAKRRVCDEQGICIEKLLKEVSPAALLFECLHPLGFNSAQIKEVHRSLRAEVGARFASPAWEVVRDRTHLLLQSIREKEQKESLPLLQTEVVTVTPDFVIPREKTIACLDADKVTLPLLLRRWKQGDSFTPLGMKGRKKVSDYLNDRKLSAFARERQCVVCTAGGELVWLVNERCDHRFRVTEQTQRVLLLQITPPSSE
ncbi:MAG: tRNA lysidine(34) synthetase TilS [Phocaeicola sp.]